MDLSSLDTKKGAESGFELQLEHPTTGVPLPIYITVLGFESDLYVSTLRAQQKRRMDRIGRGRRNQPSPEELEDESLDLLATITVNWRAENATLDGQPFPPFSTGAAKTLYRRFPWIREQVDAAMGTRANFLPKSAVN